MNNKEVYAEMLNECFNISLSMSPLVSNSICDLCVACLRSAASFRLQVMRAEVAILQQISDAVKEDDLYIKEEELESCSDGTASDNYTLAETIKIEAERDTGTRIAASVTGTDSLKLRIAPTGSESKASVLEPVGILINNPKREQKKRKLPSRPSKNDKIDLKWTKKKESPRKIRFNIKIDDKGEDINPDPKAEKLILRKNLETILRHSNATPFSKATKVVIGYTCVYCKQDLPTAEELRTHVQTHEDERLNVGNHFGKIFGQEYCAKVDIDNLRCTICNEEMNGLKGLITHLVKIHNKLYDSTVKQRIVPFNLDIKNGLLECVLCPSTHETFKMLSQHMHMHYKNFICGLCGAAFVSKQSKAVHGRSHEDGCFQCSYCEKVFANKIKLQYHIRVMHLKSFKVHCPQCAEKFTNYYARNSHLIKVHQAETQYKCKVCNQQFLLKTLLNYHIKKNHLMEKNVPCKVCGKKFFNNFLLKGHMVKHTGERNYKCEICLKSYGRPFTLREHMRTHTDDRRFECHVCHSTFIQKCSLKSHLFTNHGITMNASDITPINNTKIQFFVVNERDLKR